VTKFSAKFAEFFPSRTTFIATTKLLIANIFAIYFLPISK